MNTRWLKYFESRSVWVTGASSGIGQAIVRALGEAGVRTVASARREEELMQLAAQYPAVAALPLDLGAFDLIAEKTTRAWDMLGGIDVLINNAGFSQRFQFADGDPEVLRRVIDVNLTGTMLLTRAVVPRMIAAGSGHLVAVTSAAARLPVPLRSGYSAAKSGLHGLFDSIRGELEPHGIAITLVVPGLVRTEISESAIVADGGSYGVTDRNQANGMDPDTCAARILSGIAARRRELSVGMVPKLHLGMFMRRFLPGIYFRVISKVPVSGS